MALRLLQWLHQEGVSMTLFYFISFFLLIKFSLSWINKPKLPPHPHKLPFIGNLHQIGSSLHKSFRALAEKHGELIHLQLGQVPIFVASSVDLAREILKTNEISFAERPATKLGRKIFYGRSDLGLSPYGDYWKQLRKICMLEFLNTKRVQSLQYARDEEVQELVEKIARSSSKGSGSINLSEMLLILSNNIMSRAVVGKKYEGEDGKSRIQGLLGELIATIWCFCVGDFFPFFGWIDALTGLDAKMEKLYKNLDAFLEQVMKDHLNNPKTDDKDYKPDFVDALLNIQRASNLSIPITRDNIKSIVLVFGLWDVHGLQSFLNSLRVLSPFTLRDNKTQLIVFNEPKDMFTAGIDTTWTALDWAMAELVKNPKAMTKAQEEVRRVIGKKSKVEEEDVHKMEYIRLIVKETLRLHPPVPIYQRDTITNTTLQGYQIPQGAMVFVNAYGIARDPKLWENPNEFIPDRFENSPIEFKGQDFQFIPFGSGRRGCPGGTFASAIVELVLANLLYWFDWKLPPGESFADLDMTDGDGFTVQRKLPLQVIPIYRFP